MATHTADHPTALPLYRMDTGTYARLVEAGALDGIRAELLDGVLVDKHARGADPLHRFDVGTYERMVATGALEGERVELLDGLLTAVSPQRPEHAAVVARLTRHLAGAQAWLGVQLPLEAGWGALPEPDLLLTETEPSFERHPRTALLAVEVAVTSHRRDREVKARIYASAPVTTYWLVDVPGMAVEVRTQPGPGGYAAFETYRPSAVVPSPAAGVADLDVAALFA